MDILMNTLLISRPKREKTFILLIILFVVSGKCFSQKKQLFLGVNAGLFKYDLYATGNTQLEPFYSMLNVNTFRLYIPGSIYPNNPRGNKVGVSYTVNLSYRSISKRNGIWSLETGFENRVSQKDIKWVNLQSVSPQLLASYGTTKLTNYMFFFGLTGGKRLNMRYANHKLDIEGGIVLLKQIGPANEQVSATVLGTNDKYESSITSKFHTGNDNIDLQIKLLLCYNIGKLGIELGYKRGLFNYDRGFSESKSYSSFLFTGFRIPVF
jgi:hypothetical protein